MRVNFDLLLHKLNIREQFFSLLPFNLLRRKRFLVSLQRNLVDCARCVYLHSATQVIFIRQGKYQLQMIILSVKLVCISN